jgi:hypothetical protein
MPTPPTPPSALDKLRTAMPEMVGKQIRQAAAIWRGDRWQVFLFFTDDTEYELYGRGEMNGARHVTPAGTSEQVAAWIGGEGEWSVIDRG